VDVELPTVKTFGPPLVEAVASGLITESLIDRALGRVLRQKIELGLLDPDWSALPEVLRGNRDNPAIDLDSAANRDLARQVAEQSVILLSNDGILPLKSPKRIAVIGPNADNPFAVLGCYSFPAHVGVQHPEVPIGLALPTVLETVRSEFAESEISFDVGTSIDGGDTNGIAAAVAAAETAEVVVLVLGDRAGLFGRGTSGEGCDAESLELPGAQQQLLDAVLATGTPTVVTLLSGRPYALGSAPTDAAAIVQTFFPGEEGAGAIAGVLSGRVNPSGRLPVSVPTNPGAQPSTYLAATLARRSGVSNIDPTAAFPFGHGIGYSTFEWSQSDETAQSISTSGTARVSMTVANSGSRAGVEVVQLYLHDPVASVVRPVQRLVGYVRVELEAGQSATVDVTVPADLAAFTGRTGTRIVEPGELMLGFGRSSADIPLTRTVTLTGDTREVDFSRQLHGTFDVH
jgi:beta-xylosidase